MGVRREPRLKQGRGSTVRLNKEIGARLIIAKEARGAGAIQRRRSEIAAAEHSDNVKHFN